MKIIKTEGDYGVALERLEKLFSAEIGTPESDEADVLAALIKKYEEKHFVIEAPNPIDAIKYRMEQQGLSNKDLRL
jgi:HTH-type transcriptional regulator/antitoxin HigA